MGFKDLIITPIYLLVFLVIAFFVRGRFTTPDTRAFFFPGVVARLSGALALGLIYEFYYGGGDTIIYWRNGSQVIWEAFFENPKLGLRLLFTTDFTYDAENYIEAQKIWYYGDAPSYMIVRIATIVDFFTISTYSASALFFGAFSFSGAWAMYSMLQKKYPESTNWLAIGILFFPSVIFWGSGILKDSVTLAALGWMVWALLRWFEFNERGFKEVAVFVICAWILLIIKIYILLCFIPFIFIWLMLLWIRRFQNPALKILIAPIILISVMLTGLGIVSQLSKIDRRYELTNLAERAKITAYDIRYGWGARSGGDGGYDIGLPDGTVLGTLKLFPKAVNVVLFRPYLWEVKNPLMLFSALESMVVLLFFIRIAITGRLLAIRNDPFLLACLIFSILFAFAIGVSTFNFGTLMRYKIPLMPFFLTVLIVLNARKRSFT